MSFSISNPHSGTASATAARQNDDSMRSFHGIRAADHADEAVTLDTILRGEYEPITRDPRFTSGDILTSSTDDGNAMWLNLALLLLTACDRAATDVPTSRTPQDPRVGQQEVGDAEAQTIVFDVTSPVPLLNFALQVHRDGLWSVGYEDVEVVHPGDVAHVDAGWVGPRSTTVSFEFAEDTSPVAVAELAVAAYKERGGPLDFSVVRDDLGVRMVAVGRKDEQGNRQVVRPLLDHEVTLTGGTTTVEAVWGEMIESLRNASGSCVEAALVTLPWELEVTIEAAEPLTARQILSAVVAQADEQLSAVGGRRMYWEVRYDYRTACTYINFLMINEVPAAGRAPLLE